MSTLARRLTTWGGIAGAGGAIYVADRGTESQIAQPIGRVYDATQQVFKELTITEKRTVNEQDGGVTKRTLEGTTSDRDVSVSLKTEGSGTHVEVLVKKSAVTWDKDFARTILDRIVALSK